MRSFLATVFVLGLSASQDVDVSQFEYPFVLHADSKMNWTEANNFCIQQYGTGLATIRDSNEAETAMRMMQAANCGTGEARTRNTWIGLVQDEQSGTGSGRMETHVQQTASISRFGGPPDPLMIRRDDVE